MTISRRGALAGLSALPLAASARAQAAFPSKPLTLIVPFPAGGPADIFGRLLAPGMSASLGKPVVVENKSGAAGVTAMDFVAKAGTDAHVVGIASASAGSIMQSLMPKMPYDAEKDLAPVVLVVKIQEVLAVNSVKRTAAMPEVPTIVEAGFPGINGDSWVGVLAPAGTPKDIIALLQREIAKALTLPDMKERLLALGCDTVASTPEEFAERIRSEIEMWGKVIRDANIKMQ